MWTDNLRQFHFWCQKTLPLVYDDSLSYYEVLAKVTKHLNELTTLVNEIGDELERYEGVTDDRLDTLETWRTEVDTWRAQIDEWKADVDTWMAQTDDWKQSTENHLTTHDNQISYATGLINNTIMPFIEDMTARVADIENRLSGAEDDIDALEGRMDTAEDNIDTLQLDVTGLDSRLDDVETVLNSEYTYLGSVNYDSADDRVYITLNTSTSCDKLQELVDFEAKSDISRLTHKPVFYLTFGNDVITHFENESYPVDSRIYFQDLNADVFSYMKQGSNDVILDGLAIVMNDYNTLKTVKSGVTYRAFYIGNGLYYSFENVGTDIENRLSGAENDIDNLEGRVDDAEDDITDLQNRMSTAETNLVGLNKALRIINISISYDRTAQIFKGFCTTLGDDSFIKENITAAKISGSDFGFKVRFLMRMADGTPYDYSNIYLYDDYGSAIQYEGSDAYLNISHSSDGVLLTTIDAFHIYLLDTSWSDSLAYSLSGVNFGQLPRPTNPSTDNGKVVSYNSTLKNYELITPSGGSSHEYSTTEHEVGTWTNGESVYEKVISGSATTGGTSESHNVNSLIITPGVTVTRWLGAEMTVIIGRQSDKVYLGPVMIAQESSITTVYYTSKLAGNYNSGASFTYELVLRYTKT